MTNVFVSSRGASLVTRAARAFLIAGYDRPRLPSPANALLLRAGVRTVLVVEVGA